MASFHRCVTCRCGGAREHGEDRGRGAWSAARCGEIAERLAAARRFLEVQHLRTRPWGYRAQETVQWLAAAGYRWFDLEAEGKLEPAPTDLAIYDANLVALAEQRLGGNLRPDHGARVSALFAA
jgi:hypothetical protein